MDTRVPPAHRTAPDLVSRLVEQIVSANPMQRRFLEHALAGLSDAERGEFDHYLGFWLSTGEAGIEEPHAGFDIAAVMGTEREDAGRLRLANEPFPELPRLGVVVSGLGRPDRLDGDEPSDDGVLGQVDDAHRALTELVQDLVAA